jgi:hypothetical protein
VADADHEKSFMLRGRLLLRTLMTTRNVRRCITSKTGGDPPSTIPSDEVKSFWKDISTYDHDPSTLAHIH